MKKVLLNFVFLLISTGFLFAQKSIVEIKMQYTDPVNMVYFGNDSGKLVNNQITFTRNINEAISTILRVSFHPTPGNKTPRQNDYTLLWIEPGKIQIKGKDSLKLANVKGSKAHNEWVKYFNDWTPYNKRKLILGEQLYNASKAGDKEKYNEVMNKRNELRMEERENLYKKYLLKNPNSPIAVHMLTKYAGDGSFYSLDEAWEMYNYLSDKNRNSEAGLHFLKRLEYAGRLNVGALALDFTQNDTLGNPISLSSFKGKYVLLDFWASWCAPCRDENPNVVNAFNQYKDKNFTVIGISLDQPGKHTAWMDAIHKDNLTWTQLSDLKGWGNEVAQLYGIGSIPQNFLLDPEGKIIAKNIRGEALLTTLEKFIK